MQQHDVSAQGAAPGQASFTFTGNGLEYARIWFAGLLLTVLSLGLYAARARRHRLQYLYRNTWLDGAPFDVDARPLPFLNSPFLLRHATYRGVRFTGASFKDVPSASLVLEWLRAGGGVLTAVGLAVLAVWAVGRAGLVRAAWLAGLLAVLFTLLGLYLLVVPSLRARFVNLAWHHTQCAGFRFASSLTLKGYSSLQSLKFVWTIVTFGLYRPFATVKQYCYRLDHLRVFSDVAPDRLFSEASSVPATRCGESRLRYGWSGAVAGVATYGMVVWGALVHGVPVGAAWLADRVSVAVEQHIGDEQLKDLQRDGKIKPSRLFAVWSREVQLTFDAIRPESPRIPMRVIVRHMPGVVNAIGLCNGTIVVSDDLIVALLAEQQLRAAVRLPAKLTIEITDAAGRAIFSREQRQMLTAVLAHEISHIEHRHTIRTLAYFLAQGTAVAALTGNYSGAGAAVPYLLTRIEHKRGLEAEADRHAVHLLQDNGVPAEALASALDALKRYDGYLHLNKRQPTWLAAVRNAVQDELSTHPSNEQRKVLIREALKD